MRRRNDPGGPGRSGIPALFVSLYAVQGVVAAYLFTSNTIYLTSAGVADETAADVQTLALMPFVLKFLVGPFSDRFSLFGLGHRKPYIVLGAGAPVARADGHGAGRSRPAARRVRGPGRADRHGAGDLRHLLRRHGHRCHAPGRPRPGPGDACGRAVPGRDGLLVRVWPLGRRRQPGLDRTLPGAALDLRRSSARFRWFRRSPCPSRSAVPTPSGSGGRPWGSWCGPGAAAAGLRGGLRGRCLRGRDQPEPVLPDPGDPQQTIGGSARSVTWGGLPAGYSSAGPPAGWGDARCSPLDPRAGGRDRRPGGLRRSRSRPGSPHSVSARPTAGPTRCSTSWRWRPPTPAWPLRPMPSSWPSPT